MSKNLPTLFTVFLQCRKMTTIFICFIVAGLSVILFSYNSGPAKNGQAVSGAPFNSGKTCTTCHGGGSFGGTINLQLLDSAKKAVKSYIPGQHYTFKINMKKTSTASANYGFQTTCAKVSNNGNINRWGKLPANTHNTLLSAHNYVEQSTRLTSGIISIPWTAPLKGSGSVTFYTAGNIVNNNSSTSGDQPLSKSLTITEGVALMPVIFTSYDATLQNNNAIVTWSTSREENVRNYIVEKSSNGIDFVQAGIVMAKGWGNYNFTDNAFNNKAYYRLKVEDVSGNVAYNDPLTVAKPDKNNYKLSLYNHGGSQYFMFTNGSKQQRIQVIYSDLQGHILSSGITSANEGDNLLQIPGGKIKGMAIISVVTEDGIRTSMKFVIN